MSMSTWRDVCRPVIAAVIAANPGIRRRVLAAALRDEFPFGERRHHPYRIWLDEIRRQLGELPPLGSVRRDADERQSKLWE